MELGNAGLSQPIYHEHRLRYAREFLLQFPDEDALFHVNFMRAQGEAHPIEATRARVSCNFNGDNGTTPRQIPEEPATLDPALVGFELDVYWALVGGADPAALIRQYGARIPLLHVKDKPADSAQPDAPVGGNEM